MDRSKRPDYAELGRAGLDSVGAFELHSRVVEENAEIVDQVHAWRSELLLC